jgi:hypothetical protein
MNHPQQPPRGTTRAQLRSQFVVIAKPPDPPPQPAVDEMRALIRRQQHWLDVVRACNHLAPEAILPAERLAITRLRNLARRQMAANIAAMRALERVRRTPDGGQAA